MGPILEDRRIYIGSWMPARDLLSSKADPMVSGFRMAVTIDIAVDMDIDMACLNSIP